MSARYATPGDLARYCPAAAADAEAAEAALERACDEVDGLCFGRIRRRGFDDLSDFAREKVTKAVCLHAAFVLEYGEMLAGPLAGYGINGVSMTFDRGSLATQGGVTTSQEVYGLLMQTGLACREVRR